MLPFILGCAGNLGSGKDSFADFAVNNFGYKKLAFADSLKNEVKEFLLKYDIKFEDRNLWGSQMDKEESFYINTPHKITEEFPQFIDLLNKIIGDDIFSKNTKCSYRYLLQWWGTDYRRVMCDDNYWIKKFLNEVQGSERIVVSDVRFPNEYDAIIYNGGICIKIVRPDRFKSDTALHISETALNHVENWYAILDNDSSLEHFYNLSKGLLEDIEEKYFE